MIRKWRAVVTFYADTPEGERGDDYADQLTEAFEVAVGGFEGVEYGSVTIPELDTVPEEVDG